MLNRVISPNNCATTAITYINCCSALIAMDKLIELIENGWNIKIYNQVKRIDGEFRIKTCWEAENNEGTKESKWEGFDTAKEAIQDLINKCA